MAKFSPFKFMQEVRAEADKVTWPTRRETMITTAMVFVMVAVTSIFFLVADQIIRFLVSCVLDFSACRASIESNPILILAVGVAVGLLAFFAWSSSRGGGR